MLGHTRWASVGVISQANAHPLNSEEVGPDPGPYVIAALNGDVDNYLELRAATDARHPRRDDDRRQGHPDARLPPAGATGTTLDEAFRATVATFDGSVAIARQRRRTPDRLHLALRGSGQSLYVGLAEDAFVVASEPYGLVEETPHYLRMDGETTHGQVIVLDRPGRRHARGSARACRYDGAPTAGGECRELRTAEITTRDIDRAGFPHFLLKEISEAPSSFRKTLRGKIAADRADRPARRSTWATTPCRPACGGGWPPVPSAGSW